MIYTVWGSSGKEEAILYESKEKEKKEDDECKK